MTLTDAWQRALNPRAFRHLDRYAVVRVPVAGPLVPVEGHFNIGPAEHAADVCNEHEIRNGRDPVYRVEPFGHPSAC